MMLPVARVSSKCIRCGKTKEPGTRLKLCATCRSELPTHKECTACGITKTANHFSISTGKAKALSNRCVECTKAASKNSSLKIKYGITFEEYGAIKEIQGGKCAICQRATGAYRALAVDHDHAIEKELGLRASVRGLLCSKCNEILGHFRDDPEMFFRAITYLRMPPARRIID